MFLLVFFGGYLARENETFPFGFIRQHIQPRLDTALSLFSEKHAKKVSPVAEFTRKVKKLPKARIKKKQVYDAPTVFAALNSDEMPTIQIIDIDGKQIQEWNLNWFHFFKDKSQYKHLPDDIIPKHPAGFYIGGMQVLDNGDVIVIVKGALLRLDACGNEVWRVSRRVHHTLVKDEDDILWVPILREVDKIKNFPRIQPESFHEGFMKVSLDGEVLLEKSVFDILAMNDLQSVALVSATKHLPHVQGDLLHFNDIEPFPKSMKEGFFKHGDFVMSFRNPHMIVVFDKNFKAKKLVMGGFIRQHDPDFIDGNTLSIFDNNTVTRKLSDKKSSRIITKNMLTDEVKVIFKGTKKEPFYTNDMGRHQWLPNGNIMITESRGTRIFEINPKGKIVWEYFHALNKHTLGVISEANRIDRKFTKEFFTEKRKACEEKENS